ncbi:MAG: hypothetical protein J5922_04695, partial [Clostridia bacterium]|nr:hypothetical protein [Clostridia bacterium]
STIYCHYPDKETLFEAAFMSMAELFCKMFAADCSSLAEDSREKAVCNLCRRYLDFFLANPDGTLFYTRYRRSAYYTDEIRAKVENYEHGYFETTLQLADIFGLSKKNDCAAVVLRFFVEALLLYAEQRLLGKADKEHDALAFYTIYKASLALEEKLIGLEDEKN